MANSSITPVVTATPEFVPPTPTPVPTSTPTPTPAPGVTPEPTPTVPAVREPGFSFDTETGESAVTVAVIYDDVTGGIADGLFADSLAGVQAWAASVNDQGGLGGRRVEVTPLDAGIFNHQLRVDEVCSGEFFAIVGSQSLGDFAGADVLANPLCTIADFPAALHSARRAEPPADGLRRVFLPNPVLNEFRQAGPARWLAAEFPDTIENVALFQYFGDNPVEEQLRNETSRIREMLQVGAGMTVLDINTDLEERISERVLTNWESSEAQALVWTADPGRLIELLEALDDTDGTRPEWVLCELGCFSQDFLADGGDAVEGVYAALPHAPFDSPTAADEYRLWLSRTAPGRGWSEIGLQSWMSGQLFEEAFTRMLVIEPELPTRATLIEAARTIDSFSAGGILPGVTNPAAGLQTNCFWLVVVRNGQWVQAQPDDPLGLDCGRDNLFRLESTRFLGLEAELETSSTTSDESTADEDIDDFDPDIEDEFSDEN